MRRTPPERFHRPEATGRICTASEGRAMPGKTYKVKQGDCISSIAHAHGILPETLWNDPQNAKLKQERKDPHVLMPGDEVYVPETEQKTLTAPAGAAHAFQKKGRQEKLVIRFTKRDEPRKNEAYVLEIDGRRVGEGITRTDGDGKVEVSIPPNARLGKIRFTESGDEYRLRLGGLDPITTNSGVQGRLRDLGFYFGPVGGEANRNLSLAVAAFQRWKQLEETGELDAKTRDAIREAFGG